MSDKYLFTASIGAFECCHTGLNKHLLSFTLLIPLLLLVGCGGVDEGARLKIDNAEMRIETLEREVALLQKEQSEWADQSQLFSASPRIIIADPEYRTELDRQLWERARGMGAELMRLQLQPGNVVKVSMANEQSQMVKYVMNPELARSVMDFGGHIESRIDLLISGESSSRKDTIKRTILLALDAKAMETVEGM